MTKKEELLIRKEVNKALDDLYKRLEKKINLDIWLEKLDKRLEKIEIKNDLIHETYLDLVVLIKLHHQKLKEIEKLLYDHPELKES